MYFRIGVALIALVAVGARPASSKEAGALWDLKSYELPDGKLDLARLQRDYEKRKGQAAAKSEHPRAANVSAISSTRPTVAVSSMGRAPPPPPPTTSFDLFLRKDFSDVLLFLDPADDKSANGAEFSWTQDRIAKTTNWTANATVALAYRYFVEDIRNPFIGVAIGPYVTVNRELSTLQSQDADVVTFGLSGEAGRRNGWFGGADYLRVRGAAVEDNIHGTTVAHGAAEWLPTYTWIAGTVPFTYVNYNFTPEVEAEYDSTTASGKTLLFSGQQQALRVGPMAKLWLKVDPPAGVLDFLRNVYGTISYHWWDELYSGRTNGWLDAAVHYNLDPNGNVAVAFSYQHGRTEDTGADTDVYKVTLTAKTCTDIFNMKSCGGS